MDAPLTKAQYEHNLLVSEARTLVNARDNIIDFVWYMQSCGEKDFEHDPVLKHHLVIYEALQDFADNKFDNLLLLMPPGAGKSVLCSVQFPLWWWIRNPRHSILAASNTQNLADEFSGRRRSCMQSTEYGRFDISLTKGAIDNLQNDHGGRISAHGMETSIVGRRSNLNITDDPIRNTEQARSQVQLEKLCKWYDVDFGSRKVAGAKELMVTTRWSRNDPAGMIIDRIAKGKEKSWKVMRIPLICDSDDDPIGRKIGERLWPQGLDKNYVRKAKLDPIDFQTTYQQLPYIQDGDWVAEEYLNIKQGRPDFSKMKVVIGCDLALTQGGNSDYTVFAVIAVDNGHFHIIDIKRNRHAPGESVKTLFELCTQYPQARELLIDDDTASKVFKELILSELKSQPIKLNIAPILMPMKGLNKESRAINLRTMFHHRRVTIWQREWTPLLVQEIMGFPDGCKHDDMVDAIGLVAKRAVKYGNFFKDIEGGKTTETIMTDRYDDQGRQLSNMTLNTLHESQSGPKLSIVRRRI